MKKQSIKQVQEFSELSAVLVTAQARLSIFNML